MALEAATYINQLVSSNPPGSDRVHQGDDHIRLIKAALKATFPAITGPVTVSQDQLNSVFGSVVPVGLIALWYGSDENVPGGWAICNGSTVPRSDGSGNIAVPDLRGRVPIGAKGTDFVKGSTYGQATQTLSTGSGGDHGHTGTSDTAPGHTHGGSTGGTSLSVSQMPNHRHASGVCDNGATVFNRGSQAASPASSKGITDDSNPGSTEALTESVGGGAPHSHTITSDGGHSHVITLNSVAGHTHSIPAFSVIQPSLALHYIMKI